MQFKTAYQIADQDTFPIITREIRKHKIVVLRATQKQLEQLASVAKEIQSRGLPSNLVCRKLPGKMGHGIFLHPDAKPIPKGAVIAPYAGIVSISPQQGTDTSDYIFELLGKFPLSKEEQSLFSKELPYHPRRHYSLNLDALKKGNFTRFINHSEKPNIVAHLMRTPPNQLGIPPSPLQIIYFAEKKILPGEQLLVCYEDGEKSYWGALAIKPVPVDPQTFRLDRNLNVISQVEI
jgi:hypothetical protein